MKMLTKKFQTVLVAAASVGALSAVLGGPAAAAPVFTPGIFSAQYFGLEQFSPTNSTGVGTSGGTGCDVTGVCAAGGEGSWGVGYISKLDAGSVGTTGVSVNDTGVPIFVNGLATVNNPGGTAQITYMFRGINNTAVGATTTGIGGVMDLYYWNVDSVSQASLKAEGAGARTAADQYSNITCGAAATNGATGCSLLAELDFVPGVALTGIGAVDPTITIEGSANPSSAGSSGNANFYAEVDLSKGGLWASALAGQFFTNSFAGLNPGLPDVADLLFKSSYFSCSNGGAGDCPLWGNNSTTFGLTNSDPVVGAKIPEPSSLALFGTSLLGLGMMFRRRRAKA